MENKRVLIRRFHNQGDIQRLVESNMHLETSNPYHKDNCEWGLLIDNGNEEFKTVFPLARANGITVVPGMRIGGSKDFTVLDQEFWEVVTDTLKRCISLMDGTKRIMFDLENYWGDKTELSTDVALANGSYGDVVDLSREFMSLVRCSGVIPLFHPAIVGLTLAELLLDASGGLGVAQIELPNSQAKILEYYLHDIDTYNQQKLLAYKSAEDWKNLYPDILISNWTNETALRCATQPWAKRDVIGSVDGLTWVFDLYRQFEKNQLLASEAHYNYTLSTDTADISNNDGLRAVWQLTGADLTERLSHNNSSCSDTLSYRDATYGTANKETEGWPAIRVNMRKGKYAKYAAYDPDLRFHETRDANGNEVFKNIKPRIFIENGVFLTLPWTAILTFAIDPLIYDKNGKNAWERKRNLKREGSPVDEEIEAEQDGVLLSQWLEGGQDKRFDLFKLEITSDSNDVILLLTVNTPVSGSSSDKKTAKIKLPPEILKSYEPIKVLVSLGEHNIYLRLEQKIENGWIHLEQEEELSSTTPYQYPDITKPHPSIGTTYGAEFISLYVWDYQRTDFPRYIPMKHDDSGALIAAPESEHTPDEWPFHSLKPS